MGVTLRELPRDNSCKTILWIKNCLTDIKANITTTILQESTKIAFSITNQTILISSFLPQQDPIIWIELMLMDTLKMCHTITLTTMAITILATTTIDSMVPLSITKVLSLQTIATSTTLTMYLTTITKLGDTTIIIIIVTISMTQESIEDFTEQLMIDNKSICELWNLDYVLKSNDFFLNYWRNLGNLSNLFNSVW